MPLHFQTFRRTPPRAIRAQPLASGDQPTRIGARTSVAKMLRTTAFWDTIRSFFSQVLYIHGLKLYAEKKGRLIHCRMTAARVGSMLGGGL